MSVISTNLLRQASMVKCALPYSPGPGASTRKMTALVTPKFQTPDRWWVTADADYGMDVLAGEGCKYSAKKTPIVAFGSTFLAVTEDGGTSWGAGIPKGLDDKLRGRQKKLPKVDLVSLSTDGESYFVSFEDATAQWSGSLPDYLSGFVKGSRKIKVLALGPDPSLSYYCRNTDGQELYEGLPEGLQNALVGRKKSLPKVSNVNLGPNDAWFVAFEDGTWSANNLPSSCDETVDEVHEKQQTIREILFGFDNTWMIRYNFKK